MKNKKDHTDFEPILDKVKEVMAHAQKLIDDAIAQGKPEASFYKQQEHIRLIMDFVSSAESVYGQYVKRGLAVSDFVEGMEANMLIEGKLPKNLFDEQIDTFSELYGPLAMDYIEFTNDNFNFDKD